MTQAEAAYYDYWQQQGEQVDPCCWSLTHGIGLPVAHSRIGRW